MATYIIKKQYHSDAALRRMGNGNIWKPIVTTHLRPPVDEAGFHDWLWNLVCAFGEGKYHIIRSHAKGESRGFKGVCLCYIDSVDISIERSYGQIKSHPGFSARRQAYFKRMAPRRRFGSRVNVRL